MPSRKFSLYTLSILISAALVAFAVKSTSRTDQKPALNGKITASAAEARARDTDGDGLLDWEELVARTDPTNPDTNGDGVLDGEEQKTIQTFYEEASIEPSNTISPLKDIVAILPQLLEKSPDGKVSEEVEKYVSAAIQKEVERMNARRDPFSKDKIITDASKTLRAYINEIAAITEKHFPERAGDAGYENEIIILGELASRISKEQATGEDLFSSLDKIEGFRHRYISTVNDLKAVNVPPKAVDAHVELLNFFANTGTALEEVSAADRDVIVGVLGLQNYSRALAQSRAPLVAIKKLLEKEKVTFGADEPGKLFVDQYIKPLST